MLLLAALIPALIAAAIHPNRPAWNEDELREGHIRLSDALNWGDQALWLDARSTEAYEQDHIPGAMPLNEDDWDRLFFEVMAVWRPGLKMVVYCDSKVCQASENVAERLQAESGRNIEVYILHNGWESWTEYQHRLNSFFD